jgi:hypothetical protein
MDELASVRPTHIGAPPSFWAGTILDKLFFRVLFCSQAYFEIIVHV